VPASELLFFPDLAFNGAKEFVPVLISRSGHFRGCARRDQIQARNCGHSLECAPEQMNGAR
jgi:hypothetical protein